MGSKSVYSLKNMSGTEIASDLKTGLIVLAEDLDQWTVSRRVVINPGSDFFQTLFSGFFFDSQYSN